jgi:mono/diheme cytochrome c family protein
MCGMASMILGLTLETAPAPRSHRHSFAQARADSLPDGVTPAMVTKGKQVFGSQGLCFACHGPDGRGGPVGPNLTDATWLHGTGNYPEIVRRVTEGVPPAASKTGQIMPPRGGSTINDDQVRSVAAFVWTLSKKK